MKDYSDIPKDVESGKYIKEIPPDGTPAHEISQSLKEISVSIQYLEELRRVSDAAEARAKLAEQKAEDAEKQTKSSNRIAVFSLAVSFVSAVAAVASAVIAYMALTPAG